MKILKSQFDASVNFVEKDLTGFIESRYVRREKKYFNCYLSSQSGCNKGCRFCHLTATKQTTFEDITPQGFLDQAENVFSHYREETYPARFVHYSFMARGEALANKYLLEDADSVLLPLGQKAVKEGLNPKFNISTIMPKTLDKPLVDIFKLITPTIYYSLYSVEDDFRKKWVPAAMEVKQALSMLREYQLATKKLVKIHYAFIKDENDKIIDLCRVVETLRDFQLACEFNIVRYNPFSPDQGEESDEATIKRNFEFLQQNIDGRVRIIERVGKDVSASCGMFEEKI